MADKPTLVTVQTNFSAGELDPESKRGDQHPIQKLGMRQCSNFRLLDTLGIANRPGRKILAFEAGRNTEINLGPGASFLFSFGAFGGSGTLRIYSMKTFAILFNTSGFPWTLATVSKLILATYQKQIFIANPGQQPVVITWDGALGFIFASFQETTTVAGQKRTLFFRMAPPTITLLPSGSTGAISIQTNFSYFVAGMVGTRLRYQGRQLTITGITSSTTATAFANETLLGGMRLSLTSVANFHVGDAVKGTLSGATGLIVAVGGTSIDVSLLTDTIFLQSDTIVGPTASSTQNAAPASIAPPASVVWDEEVMNNFRGWPQSLFVDQNRLGLCDFPSLPSAIAWSAVGGLSDFYVGPNATDAIFELAPNNSRIFYVLPGPESNEIVFGDNRIYYIPINPTSPLKPGSVAFNQIATGGVQQVEPRAVDELMVYVESGGLKVSGLFVLGAYNRPYRTEVLSKMNSHLFNNPVAIAIPTGNIGFAEKYIYILNGDGTVVVGKYEVMSGQLQGVTGFVPWSGAGTVAWISALGSDVLFTTTYSIAKQPSSVVELQDPTLYLDEAMFVNPSPQQLQAPTLGTSFGTMIGDAGIDAAFNHVPGNFQTKALSSSAPSSIGYIGKSFPAAQPVGQAVVYPSSDFGFSAGSGQPITIELRAKHTAPSAYNDGTLLASATLTNVNNVPVVLTPVYSTTRWEFAFINIQCAGATAVICGQLVMQAGPLWWIAGGAVELMDQGTRMMGTYRVDADGQIIPQNRGGENLASSTLVVGQKWKAIAEPFIPPAGAGQDVGQRMWKRRINRFQAYVMSSTGFYFARLFGGARTPFSPAPGTEMKTRRFPAWNQGDNPLLPPPLREQSYMDRPIGYQHDPREAIIKDTPGPLTIVEISTEVTV